MDYPRSSANPNPNPNNNPNPNPNPNQPYDRGQHKREQHQKQAERFTRLARGTSAVEQRGPRPQTPAGELPPEAVR